MGFPQFTEIDIARWTKVEQIPKCDILFIGGTGLDDMDKLEELGFEKLGEVEPFHFYGPFGRPNDNLIYGIIKGKTIGILFRHGRGRNRVLPTFVNYAAHMWVAKKIGAKFIWAFTAGGALDDRPLGSIRVPEQLFDRTKHRVLHSAFSNLCVNIHVPMARPFDRYMGRVAIAALESAEIEHVLGGTYVTIEGPNFGTQAEGKVWAEMGFEAVGMTTWTEAFYALMFNIAYRPIILLTDYDSGIEEYISEFSEEGLLVDLNADQGHVTQEKISDVLAKNACNVHNLIPHLVELTDISVECPAHHILQGAGVGKLRDLDPQQIKMLEFLMSHRK